MEDIKSVWYGVGVSSFIIIYGVVETIRRNGPNVALTSPGVATNIAYNGHFCETAMLHLVFVVADLQASTNRNFKISVTGDLRWC